MSLFLPISYFCLSSWSLDVGESFPSDDEDAGWPHTSIRDTRLVSLISSHRRLKLLLKTLQWANPRGRLCLFNWISTFPLWWTAEAHLLSQVFFAMSFFFPQAHRLSTRRPRLAAFCFHQQEQLFHWLQGFFFHLSCKVDNGPAD